MSTNTPHTELADEVMRFLEKHAKSAADYDPDFDRPEERYSSPDAAELHLAAEILRSGRGVDRRPWSEWGSGGYGPYGDSEARAWHDDLVNRLALTMDTASRPNR